MKKISLSIAFLMIGVIAFAQQALFGGSQLVSPEIHPDNTVTFRLLAPKAVKVQITGDFLPKAKMQTERGPTSSRRRMAFGNTPHRNLCPLNYTATHLSSMASRLTIRRMYS